MPDNQIFHKDLGIISPVQDLHIPGAVQPIDPGSLGGAGKMWVVCSG